MNKSLAFKTIEELAPLIRDKEVSPVEIVKSVLERVKEYNPKINAYIAVNEQSALASAEQAESDIMKGNYRGTLHGIPMALKDIFYIKGEVSTIGSKIHMHHISDYDATIVGKLKEAGVVFTGKLNLHEYAWGGTTNNPHFGPCRNPWNTELIPGGSSGGSGAAVAADLTIASIGTDTGGSIRIPASFCGIVGLKPTHGRVSKYGCFPLAWTLDHIGPMTKTVKDAAILLEAIAGYDENDPTTVQVPVVPYSQFLSDGIKDMKIGVDEYLFKDIDANVERLVREAICQLERMGAKIEIVELPSLKHVQWAEMITILAEASTIHHNNMKERPQDFGEDVRKLLELGELPSAVDYLQAQQVRRKLTQEFAEIYKRVDVLAAPSLPCIAPHIGDDFVLMNGKEVSFIDRIIPFTAPANLTGLPSISIPCGFSLGMPVGLQLMGKAYDERTVLKLAYTYEQSTSYNEVKPQF
jgi:aspartyl-tRNA(Asn)/glutamyl-tRNA(Gln) amidotransferase subunit A